MKRGYVLNEKKELPENNDVTNDPFKIRELVYEDIKSETRKIHSLIEKANGEIDDLLRLKESAGDADEQIYDLQIELIVDDLFDDLSNSIKDLTNQAYKSFIFRFNHEADDKLENPEPLYTHALLDEEIYGKVNLWVENLKNWFLDKIDQSDVGLDLQTKSSFEAQTAISRYDFLDSIFETTTKSFFDDALESIEDFFSNLKNRIDRLIFNIVSIVQTQAKKFYFKTHGIDQYQIVLSENSNICEKCQEMDGKIFHIDELEVGVTAPPFHPNCGCTMVPYIEEEKEPEDEEEEEQQEVAPTKDQIIYDNRALKLEEMQINATYIYNYLIENGWTKNAICGMFGNMQVESQFSPGRWEDTPGDRMEHGFGLVQWTPATKLINWAKEKDLDPYDIDTQLYRIVQEAIDDSPELYQWNSHLHDSEMTFREFTQSTESPEELTEVFMLCYEKPNLEFSHLERRREYAAYWYSYFNQKEKEE